MKTDQQQLAQDLYLNTEKTQQEIADILNVHRRTIYLWVKNGRWEEMKFAARQAPGLIIQDIYNHIEAINSKVRSRGPEDRCPTIPEVEMLRKLINMTTVIQKKHTGAYIESFVELLIYINRVDPALAKQMHKYADKYIHGSLINKSFYRNNDPNQRVNDVLGNLEKDDLSAVAEAAQTAKAEDDEINRMGNPVWLPSVEGQAAEQPISEHITNNSSGNNVTFCDKNVIFSPNPEESPISAEMPVATASEAPTATENQSPKYHIDNFSQHVIFPKSHIGASACPASAVVLACTGAQQKPEPILIRKLPHLTAYKKRLWDKAFADIQNILTLYKVTSLPALHNDQLGAMFNDTNYIGASACPASAVVFACTSEGIEQALNNLKKPVGYNELITAIKSFVGAGQKVYADSFDKVIFQVKDITEYFILDERGNLQYTPELLNIIDEVGNQYITTLKGQDTYRFTQDIQKAFFANNMDSYIGYKGKIDSHTLFDYLSKTMEGIDLVSKEVIPIHKGAKGGYYADTA